MLPRTQYVHRMSNQLREYSRFHMYNLRTRNELTVLWTQSCCRWFRIHSKVDLDHHSYLDRRQNRKYPEIARQRQDDTHPSCGVYFWRKYGRYFVMGPVLGQKCVEDAEGQAN
jgi:hypothetical protein